MRTIIIPVIILLAFLNLTCKHDAIEATNPLLLNGPHSAFLGKQIDPSYQHARKGCCWGRNDDEVFLNVYMGVVRLDLASGTRELLESNGGFLVSKSNDHTGVQLAGEVNGQKGYYHYDFTGNALEKMTAATYAHVPALAVAGNNMFFYSDTTAVPATNCSNPWDYWCGTAPVIGKGLYHINRITKQVTHFPERYFVSFSKDGLKALLGCVCVLPSCVCTSPYYIVNSTNGVVLDSLSTGLSPYLFYYDDVVKGLEWKQDGLYVLNLSNQQLIRKSNPLVLYTENIKWTADGTAVYYSGPDKNNQDNRIIVMLDLVSGTQKILATMPASLSLDDMYLSTNKKKLLTALHGGFYVKDIE